MDEKRSERPGVPEIADVNHYDSRVWVRFTDGRSVTLSGQQILAAVERIESDAADEAQEALASAVLR